jgi:hypothetical protein
MGWAPAEGAVAMADSPVSFSAVADFPRSVVTFHYATVLDRRAVGGWSPPDVQDIRNERRAVRRAAMPLALSHRVATHFGGRPAVVPIAYAPPNEPLGLVAEPVAATFADWRWPPNRAALSATLAAWPAVRERVAGARLLVAGRGSPDIGVIDGVTVLGTVAHSADVLSQAAVLAFACPPSSGPKVKVLEALAYGVPVLTTSHGVEGLVLTAGSAAVTTLSAFADNLADLLLDPQRRATLAHAGRDAALAGHAPAVAARTRVRLCARLPLQADAGQPEGGASGVESGG